MTDPRSAPSNPVTVEGAVRNAMARDWLVVYRDNDVMRLRRGDQCVTLKRPRIAQLRPMDPESRVLPWLVGPQEKC